MSPRLETFPAPGGMVRARLDGAPLSAELVRALPVQAVCWPERTDLSPLLSVTIGRTYTWAHVDDAGALTMSTGPAVGEWIATDRAGALVLVAAPMPASERWACDCPHLAYEARPPLPSPTITAVPAGMAA